LSFIQILIFRSFISTPDFFSNSFERESCVGLLFLQKFFDLINSTFGFVVVLVSAFKVRFWVFMNNIVKMIIISEKGVNWFENIL